MNIISILFLLLFMSVNAASAESVNISGTVNKQMQSDGLKTNSHITNLRSMAQSTLNANTCKEAFNLLNISYIPSGGGNIAITVKYYGRGGNTPSQIAVFDNVAGIADNGYVSCPAGDWITSGQCSVYDWSFSNGRLAIIKQNFVTQNNKTNNQGQQVTASGTHPVNSNTGQAGLECINDSCLVNGQALSAQTAYTTPAVVNQILDQLAGGISGAYTSAYSGGTAEPGHYRVTTADRLITVGAISAKSNCSNATLPISACPSGYQYTVNVNKNGKCVSNKTKASVSPSCPSGYALSNGQCIGTGTLSSSHNTVGKLKNLFNQGGNSLQSESGGLTTAGNKYLGSNSLPNMNTMSNIATRSTGTATAGDCTIKNSIRIKDTLIYKPVFTNKGSICIGSDNGADNCYPQYSSTFISWTPNRIMLDTGSSKSTVSQIGTVGINSSGNWVISGNNCASFNSSTYCFNIDKSNPHQLNASDGCSGYIRYSASRGFIGEITCNGGSDKGTSNNVIAFNAITSHRYTPSFSNITDSCTPYEKKGKTNCSVSSTNCCSLQNEVVYPYNGNGTGISLYKNGAETGSVINNSVYPPHILSNYNQNANTTDNFSFNNMGTAIIASVFPSDKGNVIVNPVNTSAAPALTEYPSSPDAKTGLDFWNIRESWLCTTKNKFSFSTLNSNLTPIAKSVSGSSTSLSYSGNPSSTDSGMTNGQSKVHINALVKAYTPEYCVVISKTPQINKINNTKTAGSTSRTDFKTKTVQCSINKSTDKWTCVIPEGYNIKTNCVSAANLNKNKFSTAITDLTIMTAAAKNMVCK